MYADIVEVLWDVIHKVLEGLDGITKAEGHDETLKQPKGHSDGNFEDILRDHGNLAEGPNDIDFGEDDLTMQLVVKVMDMWDWVVTGPCDIAYLPASTAEPPVIWWWL